MMKEKPSPRENKKNEQATSPEKPRTLRTARTARPKRPTLRPQPEQEASEAEKQLGKIRAKLKGKQDILQHPEALADVWEELKDFHHPNHQPSEEDLNQLRDTLQKALYEYQARAEKIQTLRVSKTLRTERSQEFEEQREQLKKILTELMGSDNPSQAKQDSAGAFNNFVSWREQQQKKSMEKQVVDYETQASRLLEKEQDLQEKIQAATGQTAMGNSADEIRSHLKLSAWNKIKDWAGTLAGKKSVIQLIAELARIQRERVVLDRKITDSKVNLGQKTFRVPKKEPKTESQAMEDFGLQDLETSMENKPVDQAEELTAMDILPEETSDAGDVSLENLEALNKEIDQRFTERENDAQSKTEAEQPKIRERRQMKKLRQQLSLLKKGRADLIEMLSIPSENKQDVKSDLKNWSALEDYDQQIKAIEKNMSALATIPEDKLTELEPEEPVSAQAPPPPGEAEREKRLDLQAAISGRPRKNQIKRPTLRRPRTVDEDEELYEQTKTIIESASKLAAETQEAEQFELPKRRTLRQPKASMIVALGDSMVSEKLPTVRKTKELAPAYVDLRNLIDLRLGLLSKEDRLALKFNSDVYAEKAMNRDRAYAMGNDKEGEAYQASIDQLNKILNQAGIVGDREDPSMHTGGKSKGLKILGGEFLTKNSDQYTKLIPSARKSRELKHAQHLETADAPTLSVPWAQANLGEKASETWSKVAPIIAEKNLGQAVDKRLTSLMQETAIMDLKDTSADYQTLPQLMDKVRANSAYASSPEASAYVLLKAFKPKNEQDRKIQPLIDKAIKAIDAQILEIKPVVENFKQKSEANKVARESRQSLRVFDLLPSKPHKKIADLPETVSQFKQKNKARLIDRSISELSAGDKRQQTEIITEKERVALISRAGAKNAKRFGMLLHDYLESLPLKDKATALAQDRLLKEATALGLGKDKTLSKVMSYYTKEVPKAPAKPRTARTKRTAR